jgi:hypothetical protein
MPDMTTRVRWGDDASRICTVLMLESKSTVGVFVSCWFGEGESNGRSRSSHNDSEIYNVNGSCTASFYATLLCHEVCKSWFVPWRSSFCGSLEVKCKRKGQSMDVLKPKKVQFARLRNQEIKHKSFIAHFHTTATCKPLCSQSCLAYVRAGKSTACTVTSTRASHNCGTASLRRMASSQSRSLETARAGTTTNCCVVAHQDDRRSS